jgi:hypothetical protein
MGVWEYGSVEVVERSWQLFKKNTGLCPVFFYT